MPSGPPNLRSLRYHLQSPHAGQRYDVSRSAILAWIRKEADPFTGLRCLIRDVERTERAFRQAFPFGSVCSEGNLGATEGRKIASVRFDVETGLRVARPPLSLDAITYAKVWRLISEESADRRTRTPSHASALPVGAAP
jgi:hypothetical protein